MTMHYYNETTQLIDWVIANAEAISMEAKKAKEAQDNTEKIIEENNIGKWACARLASWDDTPLRHELNEKIGLLNELHYLHGYQDGVETASGARRRDD